jgi:sec-independent protein translocase protein TatB
MNGFFGVGPLEIVVIGVLALIFIGPERLPGVISQVMKTVRELREYASQVQTELTDEFAGIREDLEGVVQDVNQFAGELAQQANEVAAETQEVAHAANLASYPELMAPPPPREAPALSAPATVHTNGAVHDEDESRPAFADYRPE